MKPEQVQRYARHIALPEIGALGQERLLAARVVVAGSDLVAEVVARYLAAAGVGRLRLLGASPGTDRALRASSPDVVLEHGDWPGDGAAWLAALEGADLIVRSGFDDDPMLRAAIRRGVPAIIARALPDRVDLVSLRRHGPCPHTSVEVPHGPGAPSTDGAAAVAAGALAACEALTRIATGDEPPRARHLTVPLDGREPRAQEIPWSPECFACGGSGTEMSFV